MDLIEIHATPPPLTFLIHVDSHQRKGRCNKIKQWIKMVASHTLSSPEPLLKGDWPKKKKKWFSFLCCVIKKKVRKDWIHPKLMPILDKPSSTSTHSPSLSAEKPQEQTTAWAWLGTVVCMVLNSSCAIMWMTASSTPTVMADWMAISLTQLNWLSNGSAILNALVSFITPLAYDKLGIRSSVSIPFFSCIHPSQSSLFFSSFYVVCWTPWVVGFERWPSLCRSKKDMRCLWQDRWLPV